MNPNNGNPHMKRKLPDDVEPMHHHSSRHHARYQSRPRIEPQLCLSRDETAFAQLDNLLPKSTSVKPSQFVRKTLGSAHDIKPINFNLGYQQQLHKQHQLLNNYQNHHQQREQTIYMVPSRSQAVTNIDSAAYDFHNRAQNNFKLPYPIQQTTQRDHHRYYDPYSHQSSSVHQVVNQSNVQHAIQTNALRNILQSSDWQAHYRNALEPMPGNSSNYPVATIGRHKISDVVRKRQIINNSKSPANLIKKIFLPSDPTYQYPYHVIVEGQPISSFEIGGEFRLCLPEFVYSLSHRFGFKRIVSAFEDANVEFSFASDNQLRALVDTKSIESGSKPCPLIKLSDANRVGLKLYEDCRVKRPVPSGSHIVGKYGLAAYICDNCDPEDSDDEEYYQSELMKPLDTNRFHLRPLHEIVAIGRSLILGDLDSYYRLICGLQIGEDDNEIALERNGTSIKIVISEKDSSNGTMISNDDNSSRILEASDKIKDNSLLQNRGADKGVVSSNFNTKIVDNQASSYLTTLRPLNYTGAELKKLYNCSGYESFVMVPYAEASNLRISIAHSALGRCEGFYYPDKLLDVGHRCIECRTCRMFFSPRRFVGHSHIEENNASHWNFDSYKWRSYIWLSCRQDFNDLELEVLRDFIEDLFDTPEDIEDINDPEYVFDIPNGLTKEIN